jgi:hypothetical protein
MYHTQKLSTLAHVPSGKSTESGKYIIRMIIQKNVALTNVTKCSVSGHHCCYVQTDKSNKCDVNHQSESFRVRILQTSVKVWGVVVGYISKT